MPPTTVDRKQISAFATYAASVVHGHRWTKSYSVSFKVGNEEMDFNSAYRAAAGFHVIHFQMGASDMDIFTAFVAEKHVATQELMGRYLSKVLEWYFSKSKNWSPPTEVSVKHVKVKAPSKAYLAKELDKGSDLYEMSCGVVFDDL